MELLTGFVRSAHAARRNSELCERHDFNDG